MVSPPGCVYDNNNINSYNNNNNAQKNSKLVYNYVKHCINQIKKNEIIRNETINIDELMTKLSEMMSTTETRKNINHNDYKRRIPPSVVPIYDEYTCSICMDKEKCMAFINCGHMCICETCSKRVDKCPICRMAGTIIKIYK